MKTIISSIFFLVICSFSFSQTVTYQEIEEGKFPRRFDTYVSGTGEVFRVGDTLRIGTPAGKDGRYVHIEYRLSSSESYVGPGAMNTRSVITRMGVGGTKRTGYKVVFQSKAPIGSYIYFFEDAFITGEIKGLGMTSDEALAELRHAKEKKELGLMSNEEYEELKEKLSGFIR